MKKLVYYVVKAEYKQETYMLTESKYILNPCKPQYV